MSNPERALQIPPEVAASPIVIQSSSTVESRCEWNGVFKDESVVGAEFSPRCTAALCSIYSSLSSTFKHASVASVAAAAAAVAQE